MKDEVLDELTLSTAHQSLNGKRRRLVEGIILDALKSKIHILNVHLNLFLTIYGLLQLQWAWGTMKKETNSNEYFHQRDHESTRNGVKLENVRDWKMSSIFNPKGTR